MTENIDNKTLLQQFCSDTWWIVLVRGIAMVLLGIFLLMRPGATLVIIIQFVGAYWFVDGIFTIVASIRGRKTHSNWGWGIFVGVLSILAGGVIFMYPFMSTVMTQLFLVYFLAFLSMFFGIMSVVTGIRLRKEIDNEWSMIIGGIFSTLFGVLLLVEPVISAATLIWVAGIFSIIGGIAQVISSFQVRKIGRYGPASVGLGAAT